VLYGVEKEFTVVENFVQLNVASKNEWISFENLGKVAYKVSAVDLDGNMIAGPTEWASFICLPAPR